MCNTDHLLFLKHKKKTKKKNKQTTFKQTPPPKKKKKHKKNTYGNWPSINHLATGSKQQVKTNLLCLKPNKLKLNKWKFSRHIKGHNLGATSVLCFWRSAEPLLKPLLSPQLMLISTM